MFRWYCWVIFCVVLVFSTWAFPSNDTVEEKNLVLADSSATTIENELLNINEENDDDDDDDEDIDDENELAITDRHLRKRKPKDQKKEEEEDDSSSEENKKKKGKKSKKVQCVCYGKGKKPFRYTLKAYTKPGRTFETEN